MKKNVIYLNDWLAIHPYTAVCPSDGFFVELANQLYAACGLEELPEQYRKKICLYAAAYLEDIVSELGLWQSFLTAHTRLYGRCLPFYPMGKNYVKGEVNEEDLCFLIWNTWQKALFKHTYVNPLDGRILQQAKAFLPILEEAYEKAPENEGLQGYFSGYADEKEADRKLSWLFGHTYLTEPSMWPYIEQVTPTDRFIVPTGPLALFLHEWIDLLAGKQSKVWKSVPGLYTEEPEMPDTVLEKNAEIYRLFTLWTGGRRIIYLNGYDSLKRFLVEILQWPDDENHTLPQMKENRNFVLMVDERKGLLLAKDVCEYIADTENPYYNQEEAAVNAFRMLTEEMLCPPDLLTYCICENLLPDAELPGVGEKMLVRLNADFIARHSLLYYYRGD